MWKVFLGLMCVLPAALSAESVFVKKGEVVVSHRSAPQNMQMYDSRPSPHQGADLQIIRRQASDEITALDAEGQREAQKICDEVLADDPGALCEPNYVYFAAAEPNDPDYAALWGLAKIHMPGAWDRTIGSAAAIVAVIDTGVDYQHPDLAGNMFINQDEIAGNGVDDDGNGYVDDIYGYDFAGNRADPNDNNGHGSHVAGIIGALGNNSIGTVGINWRVSILAVKALDRSGSGTLSNLAASIDYAIASGARVINLSLGGPANSQILKETLMRARDAGVLVIAAAGNEYRNNDIKPTYPAGYDLDNIISVAATDQSDAPASFSNYGAASVHLAAPGVSILSTFMAGQYKTLSGTSMATPQVTGAAALLKAYIPSANALQIRRAILQSVDPLPSLTGRTSTGGRLNVERALYALQAGGPPPDASPAPTPPVRPAARPETLDLFITRSAAGAVNLTVTAVYADTFEPIKGRAFALYCGGLLMRQKDTGAQGFARFRVSRARRALSCFARDQLTGAETSKLIIARNRSAAKRIRK